MNNSNKAGNLLPIHNSNGKRTVDARQLHAFVGSKREFTTWIKNRIKEYGFVVNQDYIVYNYDYAGNLLSTSLDKFVKTDNQIFRTEYEITVGMGKELAMLEKNKKGRIVRQYFIQAEEKWHKMITPIGNNDNKVYPITHGNLIGFPRKEVLILAGYSPSSGTVSDLKKKYPEHFFNIGRTACLSPEFAKLRYEQGKVRQLEIDFRDNHKNQLSKGGQS